MSKNIFELEGKEREFEWQEDMTKREYHANLLHRWAMVMDHLESDANNGFMPREDFAKRRGRLDDAYASFHERIYAGEYGEPRQLTNGRDDD